ncbi:MAG: glycosyltransferase family 39 protein [Gammaproteobacteria bacterium]|nr:glycosyltransferase family 39 protein [Gammaproteobacteria bacterium]
MKRDLFWVFFIAFFLLCLGLGSYPLFTPDEGRYAEIAREMLSLKSWLIPHLDGYVYLEKPPLFYWLEAGFIHCFGTSEFALRLLPVLAGSFTVVTTYVFTRHFFSKKAAFCAALILISSPLFFSLAHTITPDILLTCLLTLSLCTFYAGLQHSNPKIRTAFLYVAYAIAGATFLTKGLIGIVFPMLIFGAWILWTGRFRSLALMRIPTGLLLSLLIVLPWLALVEHRIPSFWHFFFLDQQILRYATDEAHRHMAPWYYVLVLIIGFLPWTLLIPQMIRFHLKNESDSSQPIKFLTLWAGIIFIFFAFSHSKLPSYLLPMMPPMAILTGLFLAKRLDQPMRLSDRLVLIVLALICGGLAVSIPGIGERLLETHLVSGGWLTLSLLLVLFAFLGRTFVFIPLGFSIAALGTLYWVIVHVSLFNVNSIKPLAEKINQMPNVSASIVVSYDKYFQDLPFYLKRPVIIIHDLNELDYGASLPNAPHYYWQEAQFSSVWKSKTPVLVVIEKSNWPLFHQTYGGRVLGETTRNMLVTQ